MKYVWAILLNVVVLIAIMIGSTYVPKGRGFFWFLLVIVVAFLVGKIERQILKKK